MSARLSTFAVLSMIFVGAVALCCYSIEPFVGRAVVATLDRMAFGFRWLGINNPIACWVLLGGCFGAIVGLGVSMRQFGQANYRRLAKIAMVAVAVLIASSTLYCLAMPPNAPATAPDMATPAASASPAEPTTGGQTSTTDQ